MEVALAAADRCERAGGDDATRAEADAALAYAAGVLRMLAAQAKPHSSCRFNPGPPAKCRALIGISGVRCTLALGHGGHHTADGADRAASPA
ncbi:hypothetical protein [Pseudonocardia dioxanivorans]|uniref:hypothetical protein n=1 Tax=Pseudonocardia dioxanivorans TaxID=240495 RepID=UPI0002E0DE4D|nr:hypothetical protein [Pseudonocardia dioxanivorans]